MGDWNIFTAEKTEIFLVMTSQDNLTFYHQLQYIENIKEYYFENMKRTDWNKKYFSNYVSNYLSILEPTFENKSETTLIL